MGKSTLISRLYGHDHLSMIGPDFFMIRTTLPNPAYQAGFYAPRVVSVKALLWDNALRYRYRCSGSEFQTRLRKRFHGVVFAYDTTDASTLLELGSACRLRPVEDEEEGHSYVSSAARMCVIGMQADRLAEKEVQLDDAAAYVRSMSKKYPDNLQPGTLVFETSALELTNVSMLSELFVPECLEAAFANPGAFSMNSPVFTYEDAAHVETGEVPDHSTGCSVS